MIKGAPIALFLLPGLAHAVICKTVETDGVVAYSNVPAFACRMPVNLRARSSHAQPAIQHQGATGNAAATGGEARFEGYQSIQIVKPVAGEEVRSNEGKVPFAIALEPALQEGHRCRVYVDGALVPGSFTGLAIELTGIDRGQHGVRATVFDAGGQRLLDSAAVKFMLREAEQIDADPKTTPSPIPE